MEGSESKSHSLHDIHHNDKESEKPVLYAFLKPTYLLLGSSIPLFLGAYVGYKSEIGRATVSAAAAASFDSYSPGFTSSGSTLLKRFAKGESLSSKAKGNANNNNCSKVTSAVVASVEHSRVDVNVSRVAFKALGIGSLLSIGGFSLLSFGVFKLTDCETLDELIEKCRKWAPKKRKDLEKRLGIHPKSMQHEDVIATTGLTEDEEWEFLKKKYIPELVDEKDKKD